MWLFVCVYVFVCGALIGQAFVSVSLCVYVLRVVDWSGFQQHLNTPYVMVTALRDPLVLFVSAQQFKHRQETETLEEAIAWVTAAMDTRSRWGGRLLLHAAQQ